MVGAEHWDDRYQSIGPHSVSWYEEEPTVSLELLHALGVSAAQSVLDVGGGASTLIDHLVRDGYHDVTVLDLSAVALDLARGRLGDPASVSWLEADLRTWQPTRRWDVWHDRAVLHFLIDEADRATYCARLRQALEPGGRFVIGTFAEDGPTQCSGLPVRRHSGADLVALLGDVDVVEQRRHVHRTPTGAEQPFSWIAGRLR